MAVFSTKLDEIHHTLAEATLFDTTTLGAALASGLSRLAVAVGSGGSQICAEYLRVCRNTLGPAPTLVQTPMDLVLGSEELLGADVFLFSASGNNPDILAAYEAAIARNVAAVHIITNNSHGELVRQGQKSQITAVHILPKGDRRDGFLATHSLMGTITSLLIASSNISQPDCALPDHFLKDAAKLLTRSARDSLAAAFAHLSIDDTIVLLHDPRLSAVAQLIETSVWEAGLCSIQRTDHRNFAHGRHVWLAKRADRTVLLSFSGTETRIAWNQIDNLVPTSIRRHSFELGNCGRYQNALGVLLALTIVEALGLATNIDPGQPGIGSYARGLYEAPVLQTIASELPPAVRHKRAAILSRDEPAADSIDLYQVFVLLRSRFKAATFEGLVLDYDGTIVSMDERFDPPSTAVIAELNRLIEERIPLAIATGRGGSAGEQLREVLSAAHHTDVLIGYYNGSYIRTLDVDIREAQPATHPAIAHVMSWLDKNAQLFLNHKFKRGAVQAGIEIADLRSLGEFEKAFQAEFGVNSGVRLTRSAHTIDICPTETCKTAVVHALAQRVHVSPQSILCIGDSGGPLGNDHVLLGMPYGISVEHVCSRPDVCWSFFGLSKTGPEALLTLLRALHRGPDGLAKLDVDALVGPGTSSTGSC